MSKKAKDSKISNANLIGNQTLVLNEQLIPPSELKSMVEEMEKLRNENQLLKDDLEIEKNYNSQLKTNLDDLNDTFRKNQFELFELLEERNSQSKQIEEENLELLAQQEVLAEAIQELKLIQDEMGMQKDYLEATFKVLQDSHDEIAMQKQYLEITIKELEENKIELDNKKKSLETAFEELDRVYTDRESSIRYALRIQESMMPKANKLNSYIEESFILWKPRDVVSGDFYWYSEVNGKLVIAAVDCTGHGVPGAFMSMLGINALNFIVNKLGMVSPELILNLLHTEISNILNQEETNNIDGMDVALCVIDKKNKIVEYAGAHNPLVYVQNMELNMIKGDNLGVGGTNGYSKTVCFTKHTISIEEPTSIYIFSDGYQDEFGGPKGKRFMSGNLRNLLFEIYQQPMKEQKKILSSTMDKWLLGYKQLDDILVIGFRV